MEFFKKIIKNKKLILLIDVFLLIIAIKYCKYIYDVELQKAVYIRDLEQFVKENKEPVFKIGKIVLYRSANAIDNSDGKLENISISQFTDIAIYINNKNLTQEISAQNTIKEIYIDNIKITSNSEEGEKIFNYKNPNEFGKYFFLKNFDNNQISLNVITTNQEINEANYDNNIFYTDCSNPLTFGFINKDFIKNGMVSDKSGQLQFDGSILGNANVNLELLSGKIEFFIHIKNNLGEKFICNLVIDNDLSRDKESLLNGYSLIIDETDKNIYNFLKISED